MFHHVYTNCTLKWLTSFQCLSLCTDFFFFNLIYLNLMHIFFHQCIILKNKVCTDICFLACSTYGLLSYCFRLVCCSCLHQDKFMDRVGNEFWFLFWFSAEFGKEQSVALDNMNADQVAKVLETLAQTKPWGQRGPQPSTSVYVVNIKLTIINVYVQLISSFSSSSFQ